MSTPMPNTASSVTTNGPLRANDQEPRQMAGVAEASGGGPSVAPVNNSPLMQSMCEMPSQSMREMLLETVQDAFKQMHATGQNVQATAPVASVPTLIPNDPHVDMKLLTPRDSFKLNVLGKKGVLNRLRALDGPWADLVDVQFKLDSGHHESPDELEPPEAKAPESHVPQRRLRLVFQTIASEQAVRKLTHQATSTLELSANCGMIRQLYHVQIVGYVQVKGNDTREYLDMWCRDLHEVDVVDHFWTYQKLILSFSNINHAKKLCERGVTIRQKAYTVQPFDRRAVPKFCFKCFLPGHFKPECTSNTFTCGRCAGPHDVRTCPKGTPKKCSNCSGSHEAWSFDCQYPDTLTWRAKAKAHLHRGPDWSRDPHQFAPPQAPPPQQAAKPQGSKSSKRPAPAAANSAAKKQHTTPTITRNLPSGKATTRRQQQPVRSPPMPVSLASFQGSGPMQFQGSGPMQFQRRDGDGSAAATDLEGRRDWYRVTMGA